MSKCLLNQNVKTELLPSGNATIGHRFAAERPYFINVYAVFLLAYGGQKKRAPGVVGDVS